MLLSQFLSPHCCILIHNLLLDNGVIYLFQKLLHPTFNIRMQYKTGTNFAFRILSLCQMLTSLFRKWKTSHYSSFSRHIMYGEAQRNSHLRCMFHVITRCIHSNKIHFTWFRQNCGIVNVIVEHDDCICQYINSVGILEEPWIISIVPANPNNFMFYLVVAHWQGQRMGKLSVSLVLKPGLVSFICRHH